MAMTKEPIKIGDDWRLEVPTFFLRTMDYVRPIQGDIPTKIHKIWAYMVQYRHFSILKFPFTEGW